MMEFDDGRCIQLPTELWVNIFERLDYKTLVNVGGVCRRFRNVVLDFMQPQGLVVTFEARAYLPPFRRKNMQERDVKEILQNFPPKSSHMVMRLTSDLVRPLLFYDQLTHLDINGTYACERKFIVDMRCFKNLVSLQVSGMAISIRNEYNTVLPKLRKLGLDCVGFSNLFRLCPNLEELSCAFTRIYTLTWENLLGSRIRRLPSLEVLKLIDKPDPEVLKSLPSLFPNLKQLKMLITEIDYVAELDMIENFLIRVISKQCMETLSLIRCDFVLPDVEEHDFILFQANQMQKFANKRERNITLTVQCVRSCPYTFKMFAH